MNLPKHYRTAQILLTVGCLEFFGPMLKDIGESHLLNPEWVGHARIHLAWFLGFMLFSGFANLYLIWFRQPKTKDNLKVVALWQAMNLFGFWGAVAFAPLYDGQLADHRYHIYILGIEENAFMFGVLSIVLLAAIYFIRKVKA
ncbi:MAG: hypothetical protein GY705_11865 [Bacteroidetes bacterium]|nr:hypothetical protein [Bacteroidota bacterium]